MRWRLAFLFSAIAIDLASGQLHSNAISQRGKGCPSSLQCLPFLANIKFDHASDLFNSDALFMLIKADEVTLASKSAQLGQTCSGYKKFNDCFGGRWWDCFDVQSLVRGGAGRVIGLDTKALAHMSPVQMSASFDIVTQICNDFDTLDSHRACIRQALTGSPSHGDLLEKARMLMTTSTVPICEQLNSVLHVVTSVIHDTCGHKVSNLTYHIGRTVFSIIHSGQLANCGYEEFSQMISNPPSASEIASVKELPPGLPKRTTAPPTPIDTDRKTDVSNPGERSGGTTTQSPMLPPWYHAPSVGNSIPQNVYVADDNSSKKTTAWIPPNWANKPTTPGPYGWWQSQNKQSGERYVMTTPYNYLTPKYESQNPGNFPIWFPGGSATTQPNWGRWWTTRDWWNRWTMPNSWLPHQNGGTTPPTPFSKEWLSKQIQAIWKPQQNNQQPRVQITQPLQYPSNWNRGLSASNSGSISNNYVKQPINAPPGNYKPPALPAATPAPAILPTPDWWPAGLTKPPWLVGSGVYQPRQKSAYTTAPFRFGGNLPSSGGVTAAPKVALPVASSQVNQPQKSQIWQQGAMPMPNSISRNYSSLSNNNNSPTTILQGVGAGPTIPPWFVVWGKSQKPNLGNVPDQSESSILKNLPFPQTMQPINQQPGMVRVAEKSPNQPFWWLPHSSTNLPAPNAVKSLLEQLQLPGFTPPKPQIQPVVGRSAASKIASFPAQHSDNECLTGNDLHQVLRQPGGWANICPEMKIRCTGLLVEWRFRSALADHTVAYLSVWRENQPGIFSLVGKSEIMATSRGKQTFRPMQSIAVRKGDFLGIFYRDPSRPGIVPYLDSTIAGLIPPGAQRMDSCYSFFIGASELATGHDGLHEGLEESRGVKVHRLYDVQAVIAPLPDPIPKPGKKDEQVVANPRAADWGKMTLHSVVDSINLKNSSFIDKLPTTTWAPPTERPMTYDPWTQRPVATTPIATTVRQKIDEWLAMIETAEVVQANEHVTTTNIPSWSSDVRQFSQNYDPSSSSPPGLPAWHNRRVVNGSQGPAWIGNPPPPSSPLFNLWVNEFSWGRANNRQHNTQVDYGRSPCGSPPNIDRAFTTDIKAEEAMYRCYPGFLQVSGNGYSKCDIPNRTWSAPSLVCVPMPSQMDTTTPTSRLEVVELRVRPKMAKIPNYGYNGARTKLALTNDQLLTISGVKTPTTSRVTKRPVEVTKPITHSMETTHSETFLSIKEAEEHVPIKKSECTYETSCGQTPQVDNSMAELSYRRRFGCDGDSVRYTCLPGYKFSGNYQTIVCSEGSWQPQDLPKCEKV